MPKNQFERSIDISATRARASGGSSIVTAPSGGGGTYTAGDGMLLTGSVFSVKATDLIGGSHGIEVVSNDFRIKRSTVSGLSFGGTGGLEIADSIKGDGLNITSKVLSVKLKTLSGLEVNGDGIAIADSIKGDGLNFASKVLSIKLKTLSGLEVDTNGLAVWDDLAGEGLTMSSKVLNLTLAAVDPGLVIEDSALRLGTPGSLSATSANSRAGLTHYHAVTASADVRAAVATTLLKGDTTGNLGLRGLVVGNNDLLVESDVIVPQGRLWLNRGETVDNLATLFVTARSVSSTESTVRIRQLPDQEGRMLRIEDQYQNDLIVVTNQGDLMSGYPGYVSGQTGWIVTHTGFAEFNDVFVRGELHAVTFVVNEVHAMGGSMLVATAGMLDSAVGAEYALEIESDASLEDPQLLELDADVNPVDVGVLGVDADIYAFDIRNPPSGKAQIFFEGEIIRTKSVWEHGVSDGWFEIYEVIDQGDKFQYWGTLRHGGAGFMPAGAAVVSYGFPDDGRIFMTSDYPYAPYIDVFTTGATPWNGTVPHLRLGRLDGLGALPEITVGVKEYGIAMGSNLSDDQAPYVIVSNRQAIFNRVNITSKDGTYKTGFLGADGTFKLGTNIDVAASTGFAFDPATGIVRLGKAGAQRVEWNPNVGGGTLTLQGDFVIAPGTINYTDLNGKPTSLDQIQPGSNAEIDNALDEALAGLAAASAAQATANAASSSASTANDGVTTINATLGPIASRVNAPPSGRGLFLNADRMGYYANGAWRTYMDAYGNFYLSGGYSDNYLEWASPNLTDALSPKQLEISGVIQVLSGSNVYNKTELTNVDGTGIVDVAVDGARQLAGQYADRRSLVAVRQSPGFALAGSDGNTLTWTGLTVVLGDGTVITVSDSSAGHILNTTNRTRTSYYITGTIYLVVDGANADGVVTTPQKLRIVTNTANLTAGRIVIAVAVPNTVDEAANPDARASLHIMGGPIFIGNGWIRAGAITTANLTAGAVTANKIAAGAVEADKILVNGDITFASGGYIRGYTGAAKTFGSGGAGFFLGHHSGAYKLDVGDSNNYLRYNGSALTLKGTNTAFDLVDTDLVLTQTNDSQALITLKTTTPSTQTMNLKMLVGNLTYYEVNASTGVWNAAAAISNAKQLRTDGHIVANSWAGQSPGGTTGQRIVGYDVHTYLVTANIVSAQFVSAETYRVRKNLTFHPTAVVTVEGVNGLQNLNPENMFGGIEHDVTANLSGNWQTFNDTPVSYLRYYRIGRLVLVYGWVQTKNSSLGYSNFPRTLATGLPTAERDTRALVRAALYDPGVQYHTAVAMAFNVYIQGGSGTLQIEPPPFTSTTWGTQGGNPATPGSWGGKVDCMINFCYITEAGNV
jgi:hypothetical protein